MGFQFHETVYGKNFFEHQLPCLIRAIERLADGIEIQNKQKMEEKKICKESE